MRRRFSQSLVGYDPQRVDETLRLVSERHQEEMALLQKQLTLLTSQADSLRKNNEQLREQIGRCCTENALDSLVPAYLDAVSLLLSVREEAELAESAMAQRISQKEKQLQSLKEHLEQLPREIKAVTSRYQQALKRAEAKPNAE